MGKTKFNIKKLQFVPITAVDDKGTPTYGDAIKCPGAVSITLDPSGEATNVYADGIVYAIVSSASGYTGTLEVIQLNKDILTKIFGYLEDEKKNLVEVVTAVKEFGLQFACDSEDGNEVYFTIYRASAAKPSINLQTTEDTPTVNNESLSLTISGIAIADGTKQVIKSYAEKGATNYATYFDSITVPTFTASI